MTFDRYFDLSDAMNTVDKFVAFIAGIAPSATHRRSIDLSYVDIENRTGPSVGLACHLASGVVAAEVLKILLRHGRVYAAPTFISSMLTAASMFGSVYGAEIATLYRESSGDCWPAT